MIKPGILSSEFYVTILGVAASMLVAHGVITVNEVDPFVKSIIAVGDGVLAILAIAKLVSSYVQGRSDLKQQALINQQANKIVYTTAPQQTTAMQ